MPRNRHSPSHRKKAHSRLTRPFVSKLIRFTKRRRVLIGVLLVVLGLLLLAFPPTYTFWANRPVSGTTSRLDFGPIWIDTKLLGTRQAPHKTLRIIAPSVKIDLPVTEAKVVNGYWETSETTASHGMGSGNPGEEGNTVIFAHARQGLFAPLREIKPGATVYVLTDVRWHRYQVSGVTEVAPQALEVIAPTLDETLTLFTCSGFLDSKRLVVIAKPV